MYFMLKVSANTNFEQSNRDFEAMVKLSETMVKLELISMLDTEKAIYAYDDHIAAFNINFGHHSKVRAMLDLLPMMTKGQNEFYHGNGYHVLSF